MISLFTNLIFLKVKEVSLRREFFAYMCLEGMTDIRACDNTIPTVDYYRLCTEGGDTLMLYDLCADECVDVPSSGSVYAILFALNTKLLEFGK